MSITATSAHAAASAAQQRAESAISQNQVLQQQVEELHLQVHNLLQQRQPAVGEQQQTPNNINQQLQQQVNDLQQQLQTLIQQPPPNSTAPPLSSDLQTAAATNAATAVQVELLKQMKRNNATKPSAFKGTTAESEGTLTHSFINDANDYFIEADINTDIDKLSTIATCLKENAKLWWEMEKKKLNTDADKITTWNQFIIAFKRRFQTRDVIEVAREQILKLIQNSSKNTNATEYTQTFIKYVDMIPNASMGDLIVQYKQGLPSFMRTRIATKKYNTLTEYTNYVYETDAAYKSNNAATTTNSSPPFPSSHFSNNNKRPWHTNKNRTPQLLNTDASEEEYTQAISDKQEEINILLKAMESRRGIGGGKGNFNNKSSSNYSPSINPGPTPGLSGAMAKARLSSGVCIRCNRKGHFKPQCTNPANTTDWPESYTGQKNV
jgi:hypothetical protein